MVLALSPGDAGGTSLRGVVEDLGGRAGVPGVPSKDPFFFLLFCEISLFVQKKAIFRKVDTRRRVEAQRGESIPPRSHSQEEAELDSDSDFRV